MNKIEKLQKAVRLYNRIFYIMTLFLLLFILFIGVCGGYICGKGISKATYIEQGYIEYNNKHYELIEVDN